MHSADLTIGCSVVQTPGSHERANTFKWGMCRNFGMQTAFSPNEAHCAESGDATHGGCRPYRPAVTATGEGRP